MRGRARGWCSRSAPISDAPPHAGAFAAAANAIPSGMDVYLPIANLSVNAFVIVLLGGGVGILSGMRSEEHTSELQSLMRISYAVFCLKKKKNKSDHT